MEDVSVFCNTAMLSSVRISAWRPIKLSKPGTSRLNERENANGNGKALVRLDGGKLKAVEAVDQSIYMKHRELTLSAVMDGMRVLPSVNTTKHSREIQALVAKRNELLEIFFNEYPNIRDNAPSLLGGLWESRFFPSLDAMKSKFKVETDYLPLTSLANDPAWNGWLADCAREARNDVIDRVTSTLKRVIERCNADGRLFETVFTDCRELASELPALNVTQCQEITNIIHKLGEIGQVKASVLRDNKHEREHVGHQARNLLDAFEGGLANM